MLSRETIYYTRYRTRWIQYLTMITMMDGIMDSEHSTYLPRNPAIIRCSTTVTGKEERTQENAVMLMYALEAAVDGISKKQFFQGYRQAE